MEQQVPYGQWEKRWHPLRREWVVYAAHRNNRPWNFEIKIRSLQLLRMTQPVISARAIPGSAEKRTPIRMMSSYLKMIIR